MKIESANGTFVFTYFLITLDLFPNPLDQIIYQSRQI